MHNHLKANLFACERFFCCCFFVVGVCVEYNGNTGPKYNATAPRQLNLVCFFSLRFSGHNEKDYYRERNEAGINRPRLPSPLIHTFSTADHVGRAENSAASNPRRKQPHFLRPLTLFLSGIMTMRNGL